MDLLMEENNFLVEEQRRIQPMVYKSFQVEKDLKELKDATLSKESATISQLQATITQLDAQLKVASITSQESQRQRKELLDQIKQREEDAQLVKEQRQQFDDQMRKLNRQQANIKNRIEEYEACCEELGLSEWLGDFSAKEPGDVFGAYNEGLLIRGIRKFKKEAQGMLVRR